MAEVPPELAAEVQKLERYHAENPQGRYFVPLANAYRKMGALDRAETLLREGLRRHPDYLSAHIVLGRCLADGGATEAAVSEFRYVLSVDPQNLIALRSLGEMASDGGRTEEAARWYRELLAVDPMNEDARLALEALESRPAPSALASEEDFEGGAAWWERPAEESAPADEGLPASGIVDDDLIWSAGPELSAPAADHAPQPDEALSWGSVDLDTDAAAGPPADETPVAEPFAAMSFGDLELSEAAPEPVDRQEAQPWGGAGTPGGWDPYAGSTVELETPAFVGGEEDAAPEGEGDEVVTETIAELYARQGFHDRAAEVYRELIRRRGGDPALEARLREVERLASGGTTDDTPAAPAPFAGEAAGPATDTDDLPLLEWSVAVPADEAGEEPSGDPLGEPLQYLSAAPEDEGDDAFAASFEDGFADVSLAPAPTAQLHDAFDGFAPEPDELPKLEDNSVPWASTESEAEEVAAIFAREEAFFAPAPAEEDAPTDAAPGDEPLVIAGAAHEILADEPFADDLAADDFGTLEPFAGEPALDGYAADAPALEEPAAPEPWTAGAPADEPFSDEPGFEAPAAAGFPEDEPFVAVAPFADEPAAAEAAYEPAVAEAAERVRAEAPETGFRSVRDYLAGLASWQPAGAAGAVSAEAAAPEAFAAPADEPAARFEARAADAQLDVAPTTMEELPPAVEHTVAGDFHEAAAEDEEDDMPWLIAPVSEEPGPGAEEPVEIDGLLAAESAGAAASASADDDELYPWELAPTSPEPAVEAPAPTLEPAAPEPQPVSAFSFEEFFVEPAEAPAPQAPAAPVERAPEPPRAEEPPAQPAASAGGEDDEDLESFQAWLQSLKR